MEYYVLLLMCNRFYCREILSFRSKASKINAGNYVQVKQEASANQPHIPQFGPFQPKTFTNPINCQQLQTNVTTTKSIKASCPSKNIMSSTLKRSSTTLVHNPPSSSKPTTTKHNLKVLCPSKNIVSSTLKTSCTTSIHDPLSSKEPCKETEDPKPTTISEVGHSDEIAKEPCKETEDPKEQDENFSGRGIILPKGSKKVWKSGGKIQWTENINVDPDEIVQVQDKIEVDRLLTPSKTNSKAIHFGFD